MQEVILGPCIIPDEPVGKKLKERVLCVKDPDGYSFEITEAAYRRDPVSKVSLLVLDMEKSIDFYQDVRDSRPHRGRGGIVSFCFIEYLSVCGNDKFDTLKNQSSLFPYDHEPQTTNSLHIFQFFGLEMGDEIVEGF